MAFHLVSKHGLTATSKSEEALHTIHGGAGGCSSGTGKITKQLSLQMIKRSPEEWCTRQVVQDGLSLRQISSSEFQAAACSAMRLKHYKSHTTVAKVVMEYIEGMKEKTRKEIANKMEAGERFSAIADEWTSIRNRRYMNVCIKTSNYTANLGLIRCKGSVTSEVVCDMVKVSRAEYKCFSLLKVFFPKKYYPIQEPFKWVDDLYVRFYDRIKFPTHLGTSCFLNY
jgi:hypothetical protein